MKKTAHCRNIGFIEMETNYDVRNHDVPVETILKWKQVECWKLRNKVKKLEATVEALRKNITMLIRSKEAKKEAAKEYAVRQRTAEINRLNKKLHNAYDSIEELINSKLKLETKLKQYEQDSQND